jgi:hypothetical protein
MTAPRLFDLQRDRDPSGVSGTGVVATGVEFQDGSVALRWPNRNNPEHASTAVWPSIEAMIAVHGHQGATRVVWLDQRPVDHDATWLEKVAALAPDYTHLSIQSPSTYSGHDGPVGVQVKVFAGCRADWLAWVLKLGGSPDKATRVKHGVNQEQWRWLTPDGQVCVHYLIDPEAGPDCWPGHDR